MLPPIDECLRAALRDPALSGFAHGYLRILLRQAQADCGSGAGQPLRTEGR